MLPQLIQYIAAALPAIVINMNGFQAEAPDDAVAVMRSSGTERPWFDRRDELVQVIARSKNRATAWSTADMVYNQIKKKYGLDLPAATTAGGTVYTGIKAWAIRPVNTPQFIGDDESGRALVSFTVEVTTT